MELKNTLYEKKDGIALITINRPAALNALDEETVLGLLSRLQDAEKDDNIRVVVITGAGEKAFCAGLDLKTVKDISAIKAWETTKRLQKLTLTIEELGKPVIAAINGYALGGGLELAMACDIRIASENARVGQPEVNVGLIPGSGGTQRLPRLVGKGIAKELIFTGKMIDAKTAEKIGLINIVVPPEKLQSTIEELSKEIMSKPPIALRLVKELINNSTEIDQRIGLMHECEAFGILASTEDFKEGVSAFLEKRKPEYKGR
ncbi:MAG: enoyl-CoA hydratase-related protein [Candidatus Bathyarchaeota archaeon]|nr:enoyl-CoA hydratase-related protein [Candidatus Bathyarchaeota archaeon]MDH5787284.1 enoyl-CoA hydratase-related protein [Candidatus Bathyarchaeota archaeon]